MESNQLNSIYNDILNGNFVILTNVDFQYDITRHSEYLLAKQVWDQEDIKCADLIIRISNTAYNNTTLDVLPLDDGIYDQLLQIYKQYNPNYQIGSIPVVYPEVAQNEIEENIMMVEGLTNADINSNLYVEDIWKQNTKYDPRKITMVSYVRDPITKRLINTKHSYPELVGTLDKCKFVLNNDAISKGVFDKPSVQVFERDFIQKHLSMGIIQPNEEFEMIGELKYDGTSVEAEVLGDTIISARSRGDTAEDIATDLTPILGGYKFPNAKNVPKDTKFGIKFEAILTKYDLEKMGELRGKTYKNCRNAINGLFSASDAYDYVDYITLIPLSTSLDMPRETELKFLNKYYNSGQYNRYCVFRGNYQTILYQVKAFTESAEVIRKALPYLIDGVVISYTDPNKIKTLGRQNSVNKYSMAIKFNPQKVRTTFLGYKYTIGKSGEVIPMVYFKPCEFMGNIQTKQTIHSYSKFVELGLRKGNNIDIEYVNDVITYVTKPKTEANAQIDTTIPPEPFIEVCPYCGSKIEISDSGKSAKCPNIKCPERNVMRMVDMLSSLGFKDFSEQSVRALGISSFSDILNMTYDRASVLGLVNASNFMSHIQNILRINPINDYTILTALCFENMAVEKWKTILREISIHEFINMDETQLYNKLLSIPKIADKTARSICYYRNLYSDDLKVIDTCLLNQIVSSKGIIKPKIAFTGEKSKEFMSILESLGYDANDKNQVTKETYCLITDDMNSTSNKMTKAKKYGIPIYTKQQFIDLNNINL